MSVANLADFPDYPRLLRGRLPSRRRIQPATSAHTVAATPAPAKRHRKQVPAQVQGEPNLAE